MPTPENTPTPSRRNGITSTWTTSPRIHSMCGVFLGKKPRRCFLKTIPTHPHGDSESCPGNWSAPTEGLFGHGRLLTVRPQIKLESIEQRLTWGIIWPTPTSLCTPLATTMGSEVGSWGFMPCGKPLRWNGCSEAQNRGLALRATKQTCHCTTPFGRRGKSLRRAINSFLMCSLLRPNGKNFAASEDTGLSAEEEHSN